MQRSCSLGQSIATCKRHVNEKEKESLTPRLSVHRMISLASLESKTQ